jgi:hypothetical protein
MDEELRQFEAVLQELGELMLDLGDLSSQVVLIGGQALAVESRKRGGSGIISVTTDTGEEVQRGFTFEPDLLLDLEDKEFMAERLVEILQLRGYERTREFRWSKPLGVTNIHLDLFAPVEVEQDALPTRMTPLPDAHLVLRRPQRVELAIGDTALRIAIPDILGFLAMKVRAKLEQRPDASKDSFDIFVYVKLVGPEVVLNALQEGGSKGRELRQKLLGLFYTRSSPGVRDVVQYANTLESEQQELLEQSVVDLFEGF